MKIMLLCVGGISSAILAKRLQKYSEENGKGDVFTADRFMTSNGIKEGYDLYLIAPQVRQIAKDEIARIENTEKKLLFISEHEYSQLDVSDLYFRIDQNRVSKTFEKDNTEKVINIDFRSVIIHYALSSAISFLMMIAVRQMNDEMRIWLFWMMTIIMIHFAHHNAVINDEPRMLHYAVMFMCLMMLVPLKVSQYSDEINGSIMYMEEKPLPFVFLVNLVVFAMYSLYSYWNRWFKERFRFMMVLVRDSLCAGSFFFMLIIVRLIISMS